jgi:hypothetical protein
MDSLITAAARALAAGDPLGALKRVALRDDAPALALRGIAMAEITKAQFESYFKELQKFVTTHRICDDSQEGFDF